MISISLLFFVTLFIQSYVHETEAYNIICYHGSWSAYRNGNGKFTVEDIDANLCTHIVYGFVGINENGTIRIMDRYLEIDTENFKRFTGLKEKNRSLKTLVAVGGWNEGSLKFSTVAADPESRNVFIKSAVALLETYGFDGFDLDWEYPAQRGGSPADKENFALLLKEFRQEFDKLGYLLTAAVSAAGSSVDLSYNVPELSKYLDIINIMAYDLHGVWDGVAGENAPLYASSSDIRNQQITLNVDSAIRGWIQRGADPKKIALGLAAYGRSYTLTNIGDNGIGAPISSAGNPGKYTSEAGMMGYNEICELQLDGSWTIAWTEEQKVPYAFKGNQWIGYDDKRSISIKAEYAKSLGLGGVMLWSIETEDFKGLCGEKYPLLRVINAVFDNTDEEKTSEIPATKKSSTQLSTTVSQSQSSTGESQTQISTSKSQVESSTSESETKPSTRQSTSQPLTEPPPDLPEDSVEPVYPVSLCKKVGYVRDTYDCSIFYYCLQVRRKWVPLKQQCAGGLMFDEDLLLCNYADLVDC